MRPALRRRYVGYVSLMLAVSACRDSAVDPLDDLPPMLMARSDLPYVRGMVVSRTEEQELRVLVRQVAGTESWHPSAMVSVDGAALLWRDGRFAGEHDLRVGRRVTVWITGPQLDSDPPQVRASAILIER